LVDGSIVADTHDSQQTAIKTASLPSSSTQASASLGTSPPKKKNRMVWTVVLLLAAASLMIIGLAIRQQFNRPTQTAASLPASTSSPEATVASLIENSETFKLPAGTHILTTGTIYGTTGEAQLEALEHAGLIIVTHTVSDEGKTITIRLTRKGETESGSWERIDTSDERNRTLERWMMPIANFRIVEVNSFVEEDANTAYAKFTFNIVPNKVGEMLNDVTHQFNEKPRMARVALHKRDGRWRLSEKELLDSMRIALHE
jgi:hypothetical protein